MPVIPICAALALKARRPVKLTLTREEDMHDHTRYGTQIHLKLAAKKNGTLTGEKSGRVIRRTWTVPGTAPDAR